MNTLQDIKQWIDNLGRYSSDQNVEIKEYADSSNGIGHYHFFIYTNEHRYSIIAKTKEGGRSYLGCIVSSRKPRAGEDWTRGNDLADGDLSEETWNRILGDIVSYELVKVHKKMKAQKDENTS